MIAYVNNYVEHAYAMPCLVNALNKKNLADIDDNSNCKFIRSININNI